MVRPTTPRLHHNPTTCLPQLPLIALGLGLALGLALPHVLRLRRRRGLGGSSAGTVKAGLTDTRAVRLPRRVLTDFLAACLTAAGAAPAHAAQAADVLAYADSRGIPSHGANRADTYANEIEAKLVDGVASPVVERSSGCTAVVDGRNALGAVVCNLAMETALRLAKEHGVGVVAARNSNHFGAAGYWANQAPPQARPEASTSRLDLGLTSAMSQALSAGMIGLSFTNTAPFAAATGGCTRAVGASPSCCSAHARANESECA